MPSVFCVNLSFVGVQLSCFAVLSIAIVPQLKHTIDRVEVQVTGHNANLVTIAPTLKVGDRVVTAGVHSLRDGQTVKAGDTP